VATGVAGVLDTADAVGSLEQVSRNTSRNLEALRSAVAGKRCLPLALGGYGPAAAELAPAAAVRLEPPRGERWELRCSRCPAWACLIWGSEAGAVLVLKCLRIWPVAASAAARVCPDAPGRNPDRARKGVWLRLLHIRWRQAANTWAALPSSGLLAPAVSSQSTSVGPWGSEAHHPAP